MSGEERTACAVVLVGVNITVQVLDRYKTAYDHGTLSSSIPCMHASITQHSIASLDCPSERPLWRI